MRKEFTTLFNIEVDGDEKEVEVSFDGYIEDDDYAKYFEFENLYSVIDEDGNDILDELTDDEYDELVGKCEDYVSEELENDYDKDEDEEEY